MNIFYELHLKNHLLVQLVSMLVSATVLCSCILVPDGRERNIMAKDANGNPVIRGEQRPTRKEQTVTFCTSTQVPPHIIQVYADKRLYSRVEVMRNSKGLIGGFVIKPAIMDSPINYLDCNGKLLASFHIFAPDKEREDASMIIEQLSRAYPVHETLEIETQ